MKSKSLRTKLGLLAKVACIGLAQQSEAGVVWLASDDGTNLTLVTDGGSFDASGTVQTVSLTPNPQGFISDDTARFHITSNSLYQASAVGSNSGSDPWISTTMFSSTPSTGHSFGFVWTTLSWDPIFGESPGVFVPVSSVTFNNLTVADAFGTNLDSGPVLLWTHNTTGDTISIALAPVPEPSSSALLGLGGLALMLRRRR